MKRHKTKILSFSEGAREELLNRGWYKQCVLLGDVFYHWLHLELWHMVVILIGFIVYRQRTPSCLFLVPLVHRLESMGGRPFQSSWGGEHRAPADAERLKVGPPARILGGLENEAELRAPQDSVEQGTPCTQPSCARRMAGKRFLFWWQRIKGILKNIVSILTLFSIKYFLC